LTLPAKDVTALARCRPGDCNVKLSAAAMTRFRNQVNWSSPNAALQANEVAREMILDLVHAYQADGNAALGHYHDGAEPLSVAEQFRALLTSSNRLPVPVPELMAYLDEYLRGRPAGAEDFFYWSVVDFGLKPTVRVNHVIIYPLAAILSGVSHVIAIKQLYASHYFHTTLERGTHYGWIDKILRDRHAPTRSHDQPPSDREHAQHDRDGSVCTRGWLDSEHPGRRRDIEDQ
jgi:hypothetical protein